MPPPLPTTPTTHLSETRTGLAADGDNIRMDFIRILRLRAHPTDPPMGSPRSSATRSATPARAHPPTRQMGESVGATGREGPLWPGCVGTWHVVRHLSCSVGPVQAAVSCGTCMLYSVSVMLYSVSCCILCHAAGGCHHKSAIGAAGPLCMPQLFGLAWRVLYDCKVHVPQKIGLGRMRRRGDYRQPRCVGAECR
jgi:hypothetical protein